eukprot:9148619-Alexandrium_andersonii.AAC.1
MGTSSLRHRCPADRGVALPGRFPHMPRSAWEVAAPSPIRWCPVGAGRAGSCQPGLANAGAS